MAHIRIVDETQARGSVAEDYAFISGSYSKILGEGTPAPQVYRRNSIVPDYFRFGAIQNRVLTNDGRHDVVGGLAYKVTEKDAISLHEVGLDDEAYVDILNTVSIQTSLDRLANVLGAQPDPVPLLPRS